MKMRVMTESGGVVVAVAALGSCSETKTLSDPATRVVMILLGV